MKASQKILDMKHELALIDASTAADYYALALKTGQIKFGGVKNFSEDQLLRLVLWHDTQRGIITRPQIACEVSGIFGGRE
jgi:hypothetical protein